MNHEPATIPGTDTTMVTIEDPVVTRDWLTLEEAAEMLGRSASTLRRQAASGALKAVQTGKKGAWMVRRRDVETYRKRTQAPGSRASTARMIFQGKEWPDEKPSVLTDREWFVLVEHVNHRRSLADIAEELGNSRQAVSQALEAVVEKYIERPWD